jgi:anthranilate synthase/aminodeoxychorismate synthase-like glutamine amidotransferase
MILLIDNYDSFTFNLVHFFGDLGATCVVRRNDALTPDEALAMQPEAIVLSPGPCTPNEAGICLDLVKAAAGRVPLFGVCLGHQAIGRNRCFCRPARSVYGNALSFADRCLRNVARFVGSNGLGGPENHYGDAA